jgi:GntR family transcriptional regulator
VSQSLEDLVCQCQVGEQLPPEPELAQQLGVSRATLREAMRSFEERGLIVRKHGVGTFVAPSPAIIEAGLEELESLDTLARRIGLETRMGEALIEEREASTGEADCLHVEPGTQVLAAARVMLAGARPVAYLIDVVPTRYLRQQDLNETFGGSVLDLFIERGQPALSHSRTDIMAEAANDLLAHLLKLRRGNVLLKLESQLHSRDGRVVDYSISYFVPGYFRFHVVRRVGKGKTSKHGSPSQNEKNW